MNILIRFKAAWRAFKNPHATGGIVGFAFGGNKLGFVGSPIIGNAIDPQEVITKRIMETSDVMRNWGNPAVREAALAYQKRRNFG